MKTILLLLLGIWVSLTLQGQEMNQEITLENNQKMLVGPISQGKLMEQPYATWFKTNYDSYTVDKNLLTQIKPRLNNYKILLFLGTWCGDSQREVPRFIKLLKALDFPMENLKIVALDRRDGKYKKSPNGEEWGLNILRVPTIIYYKNGREINRIIESPNNSLESDMLQILSNEGYQSKKAKSYHFD
ncbi:TlpA family protein disulfide reductase [Maribacter sp. CXY002]|uniref:TlpA family protein disulfide reductase n=1 Tax=Maribacter luteocoastalis TaxID=3407671 RepID=UPI003B67D20E